MVRLKTPQEGAVSFPDMVKGPVTYPNAELDDLIIRRADGSATYHMAVISDDHAMGVTHVLRGDDHLNNTPRQIHILQALGFPVPVYGHVPMILGPDKKKLSKRHGAMSVMEYEKMGFLPEAVVNYLARLGWAHGDQEIFTLAELVAAFGTENLNASAACFDLEKMLWVNAHHLRAKTRRPSLPCWPASCGSWACPTRPPAACGGHPPVPAPGQDPEGDGRAAAFFFTPDADLALDPAARDKFLTPEAKTLLSEVRGLLAGLADFSAPALEAALSGLVEARGSSSRSSPSPSGWPSPARPPRPGSSRPWPCSAGTRSWPGWTAPWPSRPSRNPASGPSRCRRPPPGSVVGVDSGDRHERPQGVRGMRDGRRRAMPRSLSMPAK